MTTTDYKINEAIDVSANKAGKVLLTNLVTKKKVELSAAAYHVLLSLNNTWFSEQAFMDKFPDDQHDVAELYFKFLKQNALVIGSGHFSKPQISEYTYGLYNAMPGDLAVKDKCVILGLPFDKGNSESLSINNAPSSLRALCKLQNIDFKQVSASVLNAMYATPNDTFSPLLSALKKDELVDVGDLYCPSFGLSNVYYDQIREVATTLLNGENKPFFLGGDHSVSLPLLQAFSEKFDKFGVLHIDAHSDLYAHALDIVFKETSTHHHGNFVCDAIELPSVAAYHLIGIRGLNTIFPIEHDKLKIHYCSEIVNCDDWIAAIDDTIPYYITFDIDVLDYSIAPATCTPVPGGVPFQRIIQILTMLTNKLDVIGADIVEYDTGRDIHNITAQTALSIMPILLNALCKNKN